MGYDWDIMGITIKDELAMDTTSDWLVIKKHVGMFPCGSMIPDCLCLISLA